MSPYLPSLQRKLLAALISGGNENEIRTVSVLGSFATRPVARRLLVFPRCKWLNSPPPAVRNHFGGRALLHRRYANRLEMRGDGLPCLD